MKRITNISPGHNARLNDVIDYITRDVSDRVEKLEALFTYVRDEIRFDIHPRQFMSPEEVLQEKRGACMNKAVLLFTMASAIGFKARLAFMWVSKEALVDLLHPIAYRFWADPFLHTYPEIEIDGMWKVFEPTFDRELHEACLREKKNFARFPERRNTSIEFSINGIIGAQHYARVKGMEIMHAHDLTPLQDMMKTLPLIKRKLQPFAYKLSSQWIHNTLRRKRDPYISNS